MPGQRKNNIIETILKPKPKSADTAISQAATKVTDIIHFPKFEQWKKTI